MWAKNVCAKPTELAKPTRTFSGPGQKQLRSTRWNDRAAHDNLQYL